LLITWSIEWLSNKISPFSLDKKTYEIIKGEDANIGFLDRIRNKLYGHYSLKKLVAFWCTISMAVFFFLKDFLISIVVGVLLTFLVFLYIRISNQIKRKDAFILQFRECLISMSNSLKAGATLPIALERCRRDLNNSAFSNKQSLMIKELDIILINLNMGNNLADILIDFKERMQMEEVDNFVNAAVITEKSGGNLSEAMINVCNMIGDRIQIKREIESLTASKRSEARVLTMIPIVLVPLLVLLAPSYLKPMYENPIGKVLMVIGVLLVIANYIIGKKIMDIKL
jgi:tight adherence protein B